MLLCCFSSLLCTDLITRILLTLFLIISIDCVLVYEQVKWPSVPVCRKPTQKFNRYFFSHLLACLMVCLSCPKHFLLELEGEK